MAKSLIQRHPGLLYLIPSSKCASDSFIQVTDPPKSNGELQCREQTGGQCFPTGKKEISQL